jgi:PleD family two-component response regulator
VKELGEVLVSAVRDTDTVCYLQNEGAPRFGVVLPETDYDGALNAANKIRVTVAGHDFEGGAHGTRLTVRCGAATINHERMGRQDLLAVATTALEAGLAGGPNRTHAVSQL